MSLPYAKATSGTNARAEIERILKHFGCKRVGFMDDYEDDSIVLAFTWEDRNVQLRASARGWAAAYLREAPWNTRRHLRKEAYEQRALDQGRIAVNSILRDWVKGQVTAIETGILSFEHVFMPYMLAADGRPMIEHATKLLEAPNAQ